ncbi:hypothetical protein D9757_003335 [Collybiopsis confluens]|uniref:INO80 complex subunit B-like conserved region domain-containing protein n=1 Tax=Collybiopsis confluens TaxID=2823264 RepID=A0A8H5HYS0_9AGAR|nr:hypothetical protein D9757_003335 [Collybiopsis confluens]
MAEKTILVTGATGRQGQALIRALNPTSLAEQETTTFRILALTRNAASPSAISLRSESHVDIVEGNLDSQPSIRKIFEDAKSSGGIWGVFCVLCFPGLGNNADHVEAQGKLLANLALEFGVSAYIFSSAERGGEVDDDKFKLDGLAKVNIERHVKDLGSKGLPWTILRPGFFMENYEGMLGSITVSVLQVGLQPETAITLIAADDIGQVAAGVFRNPDSFRFRILSVYGERSTMKEQSEAYKRATGRSMSATPHFLARVIIIEDRERIHTIFTEGTAPELDEQNAATREAYPALRNFETWCREQGSRASSRQAGWNNPIQFTSPTFSINLSPPVAASNTSWNFAPDDDDYEYEEMMRRLRSNSGAQALKQKAEEEKAKASHQTRASTRGSNKGSPAKGKARAKDIESEDDEGDEAADEEVDADGEEEADVDIEGDAEGVYQAAGIDSDPGEDQDEDDSETITHSPIKPRLRIKLKLPTVPASSTSNTATPTPEEERKAITPMTPGRRAVAKRSAAVRGRRRIQDLDSSSSEIESEGSVAEEAEGEEDEDEDEEMDGTGTMDSTPAPTSHPASKAKAKPRLTTRQAVLASVLDPSHVALDSDLAAQSIQGNASKKKKVLNETELALRREENARKRKNLSEKRLEDEKLETINRLLKKQTKPRAKRAGGPSHSASSSVPPSAPSTSTRGGATKRGGRGRGRKGRSSRAGIAEDDDVPEGEAMDVDDQEGPGEAAEEGEEEELGVDEEEAAAEESTGGGSEKSKPTQGPVVPMFRWVSTTVMVPAAPKSQLTVVAGTESLAMGPVEDAIIADSSAAPLPQPLKDSDEAQANNAMQVDASAVSDVRAEPISNQTLGQEKQMRIYLAVPATFLPPASEDTAAAALSSTLGPQLSAVCAVSGCGLERKYRLVKDWKIGACGMEHLKVLEGRTT